MLASGARVDEYTRRRRAPRAHIQVALPAAAVKRKTRYVYVQVVRRGAYGYEREMIMVDE